MIGLQREHVLFFMEASCKRSYSVKLEVFLYYLLDKAHLTQGRFLAVPCCCALCCRGQSCGLTLWELDCSICKGWVWETTGIQALQASGRKGKPNWVTFFPLWFSFRVTTDEVQILLFTALLNTSSFGFLSWLKPCFSWGMHIFQLF